MSNCVVVGAEWPMFEPPQRLALGAPALRAAAALTRRRSGLRLRQTIHAVESGLHRRDQLAVVEGLCQPT